MRNFKKFLALVLAMMMVVGGMVTVSAAEETAATYDYTAAAEALAELGIVKGTSDDVIDFALEDKVVRYQMALLVARIMTGEVDDSYWNKVVENTTPFDDVTKYYGAIAYVADNEIVEGKGWIAGVGDNCFDPEGPITYEQALTMAVRALGYKQLVYPTGFVNTAEELGLTEGLEELAGDTQLTRGQMFQIIYNLFFTAGKDGSDFATKAFGLQTETYVVVATELQALLGAERVYRVDYEGKGRKYDKYVALAPINEDGTYNLDAVIHMTETELGMDQKESEYRLGYSYVVKSFDKFANAYIVEPCKSTVLQNYGDDKQITAGALYHNMGSNLIKLDGTTYKLVDEYTNLNNKTYANRNPEIIVHSMYEGETSTTGGYYIYDEMFNILDPESATGEIALLYNQWTNTYYVKVGTGYRVATDADFAKYAVGNDINTSFFGVVTDVSKLLNDVEFCEITLFDDNDDGVWDRGIYIPYSFGKYYTYDKDANTFDFDTVTTVKGNDVQINNAVLGGWGEISDGTYGYKSTVAQSSVDFIGGRPKNDDYLVYWYNPQGRVFCTIEKTAMTYAKVTALNQGTYSYDSKTETYYWKNATVTLEGEEAPLVLGYRPYVTDSRYVETKSEYDLVYFDKDLALYGYNSVIYECLANSTYLNLGYVVLAGRVVDVAKQDTRAVSGSWMFFDYGVEGLDTDKTYTYYTYEGDILGVDEDGNILVNAWVDGETTEVVAKIGSINGFDTFGELVADYAALNFQFTGIGILGAGQYETLQKIIVARFFETLTYDLDNGNRQMLYTVTDVDDDGVYSIRTDVAIYWGSKNVNTYIQPQYIYTPSSVSGNYASNRIYYNGRSTNYNAPGGSAPMQLHEESIIVCIGNDGVGTATGIPTDGAVVNSEAAYVFEYNNDIILLFAPNASYKTLYTGKWDDDHRAEGYTYYMVSGKHMSAGALADCTTGTVTWDANGVGTYTYKNLFNLNSGEFETKTVVGGLEEFRTTENVLSYNVITPLGAIYAEKNGKWTLINEVVTGDLAVENNIKTVKYAPNVTDDLAAIVYNTDPEAPYAPVMDTYGIVDSPKAGTVGSFFYKDENGVSRKIVDTKIALSNNDLLYTYTDINGAVIWVQVNTTGNAHSYGSGGTVYFEYKAGEYWHSIYLGSCDKYKGVKAINEYAALDKFDIDGLDLTELVATYIAKVDAQSNTANVMAQAEAFKAAADKALADKIAADLAATEQELADAKTAAIAKIAAIADKYDDALVLSNGTTVANQEAAFVNAINACTLEDQAYLTQIDAKAEWFEGACAAAKTAADKAAADAAELTAAKTAAIAAIDAAVEKTADAAGYSTSAFKSSSTKYTIAEWYTRITTAINAQTVAADVDPLTVGTITKSIEDWATYMADYVAEAVAAELAAYKTTKTAEIVAYLPDYATGLDAAKTAVADAADKAAVDAAVAAYKAAVDAAKAEAEKPAYVKSADAKTVVVKNIVDGETATKFNSLTIYKMVGGKYEAVGTWSLGSNINVILTPGNTMAFNTAINTGDVKIGFAYDADRTITLTFSHFDGMEWVDGYLAEGETYGVEFNLATGKTLLKDITIG